MEIENQNNNPQDKRKRKRHGSPESEFRSALDACSKKRDLLGAISLYENALSKNLALNHYHFNTLLYLCSNSLSELSIKTMDQPGILSNELSLSYGFRIYDHMVADGIAPTEATITAVARLAAVKGDGDLAFELVKNMTRYNISPRLRSYWPALFTFCRNSEDQKAYEVEEHMKLMGVQLEELEISALLKVSAKREDKFYMYLHKLRNTVRCVSSETGELVKNWFNSDVALEAGKLDWDQSEIQEAEFRNGGGWHGQGWLGKGKWEVYTTSVSPDGFCHYCGEKLACVDLDVVDTAKFADSISSLALKRETELNFREFQVWLESHSDYKFMVDGANIGLYQQNFADGGFSILQSSSTLL